MTITQLRRATPEALRDINALLPQLTRGTAPLTMRDLRAMVVAPHVCLVVAHDVEKIVGMGILVLLPTAEGIRARIEDMVVDKKYRGRGIGRKLAEKLLAMARRKNVSVVELSSRPSRIAANKLYRKMGFKKHETNVYKMRLL